MWFIWCKPYLYKNLQLLYFMYVIYKYYIFIYIYIYIYITERKDEQSKGLVDWLKETAVHFQSYYGAKKYQVSGSH